MRRIVRAGVLYFLVVFAAGFTLGVVRAGLIEPAIGAFAAVALETPLMLAVAWLVAARVAARLAVPARVGARLVMGGVAFVLLLGAEALLAAALGVRWAPLDSAAGRLGLTAQAGFALIPALRLAAGRR